MVLREVATSFHHYFPTAITNKRKYLICVRVYDHHDEDDGNRQADGAGAVACWSHKVKAHI